MDKEYIQSTNDNNDKKSKFLSKFFTIKNLKIIMLVIIAIVAFIIFLGLDNGEDIEDKDKTISNNSTYLTTLDYCTAIESKLENVLSKINGAGEVSVIISVEGSPEYVYATDNDSKTSSTSGGSTTTSSSSPIIINGNGASSALILTENMPSVKGVIVVASGASQINVKLDILNSVSKLLDLSTDKISVLKGI